MIKNLLRLLLGRFPVCALYYRTTRDFLSQRSPSHKTPWGFTFAGNDSMATGNFEPNETEVVRRVTAEVDVLVNVGANVGYYCCHALSMGKPVVAIEPNSRNLHYLLKNIESNGWAHNAEIFPVALGTTSNILQMWGGGLGHL